jgi:flagellar basal body-associated protein FliL
MKAFRKLKIAIVCILLPAMVLLAANAVFNWHVHKQADGTVLVHAHPYNKSGSTEGTSHHHSSSVYFSLHQITAFFFSLAAVFYLAAILGKVFIINTIYLFWVKRDIFEFLLPNRAPPLYS